jgi:uncharacterized protein (DUF1778 family)
MNNEKPKRTKFLRLRLTPEERQIIEQIIALDNTNISEHLRRSLNYYASHNFPALGAIKS